MTREVDEVQALSAIELRLAEAQRTHDGATLGQLVAPGFEGVDAHGRRTDRDSLLHAFLSQDLRLTRLDLADLSIRVYCEIGLVLGRALFEGSFRDQSFEGASQFTDVWVRREDGWRLIASHVTCEETA